MLIVPNHHVIVPQTRDIAFQINEIKAKSSDVIYIELFGDSIVCGRDPDQIPPADGVCSVNDIVAGRVNQPPGELITILLPQYRMSVTTRSVGNSTSGNLLLGTDGVNSVWPDDIEANIVLINHGLNDALQAVPVNNYKENLIDLRRGLSDHQLVVWQTPTRNTMVDVAPYVQAMKEVAQEFDDTVADAYSMPGWLELLPDGMYPRQLGYVRLVDLVIAPAINKAILKLFSDRLPHKFYRLEHQQRLMLDNQTEVALDFTPAAKAWVEIYHRDYPIYQAVSKGNVDQSGSLPAGFYNYSTGTLIASAGRSYNLIKIRREDGRVTARQTYDIAGNPALAKKLATELNRTNHDYIVIVYTYQDPKTNRLDPLLIEALYRCGASREVFSSTMFRKSSAYTLVGIPGVGQGGGFEAYSGETDDDSAAYSEIVFELLSDATPWPIDIYPSLAKVKDSSGNTVVISNSNYKTVVDSPVVNGTRIINGKYPTSNTKGILFENYNIVGNKIYFENPLSGMITVVCDTQSAMPANAHVIDISNIHSYDYYTYRFNNSRWARGNPAVTLGNVSNVSTNTTTVTGANGVNALGLTNTYINMRVGDALYADPVVLTQPFKGYVKLTSDRKKMVYVPFPNTYGLDSFSYTMLTQHGQIGLPASVFVEIVPGTPDPEYYLSANKNSVPEGNSVTISLTTLNVTNGTSVPYEISGVDLADIGVTSFVGNFVINNGNSSVTFNLVNDRTTEGTEILTLSLTDPDIFQARSISIPIADTSLSPIYSLTANVPAVREGDEIEFVLSTQNVANGEIFPYTISGISSADIVQILTGTFTISNNSANTVITVIKDTLTEGTENIIMTLNSILPTVSTTVTILDTSRTPTYTLSANRGNIAEGESVQITLTTTDVNDGTVIPYVIGGVNVNNDLVGVATASGTFTINSNVASRVFTTVADLLTEGTESLIVTLAGSQYGTTTVEVPILDTSRTPVYTITANRSNVDEGQSVVFTLSTESDVPDGTLFNYQIVGTGGFGLGDLEGVSSLFGVFVLNGKTASTPQFTLIRDRTTEPAETFGVSLVSNSQVSASVTINDTSKTPTYAISSNVSVAAEGDTLSIILTTTGMFDGEQVPGRYGLFRNTQVASGTFNWTIANNTATYTFVVPELPVLADYYIQFDVAVANPVSVLIPLRNVVSTGFSSGWTGSPLTYEIDFGNRTGTVGIRFQPGGASDRAIVNWNGSTVIDTGFVSGGFYNYTFNKTSVEPRRAVVTIFPTSTNRGSLHWLIVI